MSAAARISRHIRSLIKDEPFSIRDFLCYGSRPAVDQTFYRLVKAGHLLRVARGVFVKPGAPQPSILAIAQTKARAFGKIIASHGAPAAKMLNLSQEKVDKQVFLTHGHSTNFRAGESVIYLHGASPRKMILKDDAVGLAIKAMWHLGPQICDDYIGSQAVSSFKRLDREQIRRCFDLMPDWMTKCFPYWRSVGIWPCRLQPV
jgi:hypothetical protein